MIGIELPCRSAEDVARVVRALGAHRYVAGRLIEIHAAMFDAVSDVVASEDATLLQEGIAWARSVFRDTSIDAGSRDERLHRRSSEKEAAAVLAALWGSHGAPARARLRSFLVRHECEPDPEATPFDEDAEEDMFPVLIDAGWELLPLAALDRERHRGAIEAFDEPIAFEAAKFEETSAIPPKVTLHELSAIGAVEALTAIDASGALRAPLVLWTEGEPIYLDYVLRGVLRAAKLDT